LGKSDVDGSKVQQLSSHGYFHASLAEGRGVFENEGLLKIGKKINHQTKRPQCVGVLWVLKIHCSLNWLQK